MAQNKGNKAKGRQSAHNKHHYEVQFFRTKANKANREADRNKWLEGRREKNAALSRRVREYQKFTQADLAVNCGVSVRTVQGWEMGKAPSGPARLILKSLLPK